MAGVLSFSSELMILVLLVIVHGLLAMAEAAMVASRKGRLRQLAEAGSAGAARALAITEQPARFLALIQFWRTVLGMIAGVFGGAVLVGRLAARFSRLPEPAACLLAFFLVILGLALVFLVFGELLPKRTGLAYPEKIAAILAGRLRLLGWLAGPFPRGVELTADAVARLVRLRPRPAAESVGEDEVRALGDRGLHAGVFQPVEVKMVEGVLTLDQVRVASLMTPRPRIVFLNLDDPEEANWRKIVTSGHSYFPVYQHHRDQIVGVVTVKALWAHSAIGLPTELKNLLMPPLLVPETMTAMEMLEQFKKTGRHVAIVVDEFGAVQGLVTLIDVFEAIVGDLPERGRRGQPEARHREDGSWVVDAALPTSELKALLGTDAAFPQETSADYRTLGGLVLTQFGRIPAVGDRFEWQGWRFEVAEMDRHRVDKVVIGPAAPSSPSSPPAP